MASGTLLPSGYLSTAGNQIIDASGQDVRIASVGWNGNPGDISASVAQMAADGFNTIRVSWVDATLASDLTRLELIVAAASANSMKVIIDHHTDEAGTAGDGYGAQQHNGLWIDSGPGTDGTNGVGVTGTVTAAQFKADWETVAKAFAGNATVIGFDVDNEPFVANNTGASTINWGQGGPTDIQAMYNTVGSAIETVDPGALIIAEGPQNWTGTLLNGQTGLASEGDLSLAQSKPVTLTVNGQTVANKVVYSGHEYPSPIGGEPVDSGAAFIQQMNAAWGYLETNKVAPVWIGEMGGSLDGSADSSGSGLANEQAWASTLVGYMNGQDGAQGGPTFSGTQQGVGSDWWNWGNNAGQYPDGTLNPDGSLNSAQEAVYSQLRQTALAGPPAVPSANDTVVKAGSAAAITDGSGNKWTITSGAQVAVNGAADTTTAGVIGIAYVNNTIWQENASKLWWGETSPNASWSPTAGTSTSPLPAAPQPSPNDTVVKGGSTATITDASGNKWSITSGAQVAVNGVADTTTAGVIELAYVNRTIWQENASKLWWEKTSSSASWSPTAGTSTSPLPVGPTASPNDTVVEAGSTAAVIDASGNKWTITSGAQVAVNGVADATTGKLTELAYVNKTIWQENAANLWWSKTTPTASWGPTPGTSTSPLPAPIGIPAGQASVTVSQSQISLVATSGTHMLFISGTGDIVNLSGGADTITDTGGGNTYAIPAANKGYDTFASNILTKVDTLDLKTALAATNWNGAAATVAQYLSVKDAA